MEDILLPLLEGHQMIHKSCHGQDNGHFFSLHQRSPHFQALLLQQIAVDVRLKENKIFGRIEQYIPVKEFIVFVYLFRPQVIGRHNNFMGISLPQTVNKVRFLGIDTAGHLQNACIFL